MKYVAAVLLAGSLACAGPASRIDQPHPGIPLTASLLNPTHGVGFYVNRESYVAVFDILPGRGIGLYYPEMNRDLDYAVLPGPRWVTIGVPYLRAAYRTPVPVSIRYLFLVASREPLNIEQTSGYDEYLREKLGPVFTGDAYTAMKALVQEVVPPQPPEDWTTALYLVYGGDRNGRGGRFYHLVYCSDGRMYWVDINQGFVCPPPADSTARKTLDEDGKKPADKTIISKGGILAFSPIHALEATDLLRRPVTRIDPAPLAPESRSAFPGRSSYEGRIPNDPSAGGAGAASGSTGSTSTVQTPAQSPSNPRGRVTDDSNAGK